jgi:hypothetical protein
MSVPAGVVEEPKMATLVTLISMAAHGHGPTVLYREKSLLLLLRHVVLMSELLSVLTDDVSNPEG